MTILVFITVIYNCLFTCLSSPLLSKFFGGIPSARKMLNTGSGVINILSMDEYVNKEKDRGILASSPKSQC